MGTLTPVSETTGSLNSIANHIDDVANPHSVTQTQVGLSNVDNTSDVNKPVSTAQQAALDLHSNDVANPHAVTQTQVGLGNVDNTSDVDKPVSTAQQGALDAHTTNLSNPHTVTQTQVGLSNVDNTSDVNKPVSTAQQTAIDNAVAGLMDYKGGYDATTNTPDLDTSPVGVLKGDSYTVTVGGSFFTEVVEAGDIVIAEIDSPTVLTDWTVVNKNLPYTPVNRAGDTMTGDLVLNADPTAALGAATKQYVDDTAFLNALIYGG